MSVYLKDGKVLLDSGKVAVDAACCCGTTCNCPNDTMVSCSLSGDITVCDGGVICTFSGGSITWTGGEFLCRFQGGATTDCNGAPIYIDLYLDPPTDGQWYGTIFFAADPGDCDCSWNADFAPLTLNCCPNGTYELTIPIFGGECGDATLNLVLSDCDGTTCEGACCDGTDCSTTTEADCTGMYQGDGTTCDPNPCPSNCCGEAFVGFMGGGPYLTKTTQITRTAHTPGCDMSASFETVETLTPNGDNTCSSDTTCSGSATYTTIPPTSHSNCNWESDGAGGCHWVLVDGTEGCYPDCASVCLSCDLTPSSDTVSSCTCDFDNGSSSASYTMTVTLSNPCSSLSPAP